MRRYHNTLVKLSDSRSNKQVRITYGLESLRKKYEIFCYETYVNSTFFVLTIDNFKHKYIRWGSVYHIMIYVSRSGCLKFTSHFFCFLLFLYYHRPAYLFKLIFVIMNSAISYPQTHQIRFSFNLYFPKKIIGNAK